MLADLVRTVTSSHTVQTLAVEAGESNCVLARCPDHTNNQQNVRLQKSGGEQVYPVYVTRLTHGISVSENATIPVRSDKRYLFHLSCYMQNLSLHSFTVQIPFTGDKFTPRQRGITRPYEPTASKH